VIKLLEVSLIISQIEEFFVKNFIILPSKVVR